MAQKRVISTTNSLIETLKDGEEGFRQAAEAAKNPGLKSLFNEFSQQRSRFATELETQAKALGKAKPERASSAGGAMHRAWMNLKFVISSGDDDAILAECERGEDSAVNEYKEALEDGLTSPLRDIVSRQYREVQAAHDLIRNLREAARKS
jgi:uncharacterized protein (TIGR02284 family)